MSQTIEFYKLKPDAILPSRGTEGSVGYDLTAIRVVKIENGTIYLGTGLAVIPPKGYHTEMVPRSSISKFTFRANADTYGLVMANSVGIIDQDYRGELIFAFRPVREESVFLGDGAFVNQLLAELLPLRIGQLIVRKSELPEVKEVFSLDETERGDGGFGSTGK